MIAIKRRRRKLYFSSRNLYCCPFKKNFPVFSLPLQKSINTRSPIGRAFNGIPFLNNSNKDFILVEWNSEKC